MEPDPVKIKDIGNIEHFKKEMKKWKCDTLWKTIN